MVTACATGTHSIGEAFRSIQYGEADVMLAGGTENAITPIFGCRRIYRTDRTFYFQQSRALLYSI